MNFKLLLGPASCKFYISCTEYAILQLEERPIHSAIWQITKRLLNCNPVSSWLIYNEDTL